MWQASNEPQKAPQNAFFPILVIFRSQPATFVWPINANEPSHFFRFRQFQSLFL